MTAFVLLGVAFGALAGYMGAMLTVLTIKDARNLVHWVVGTVCAIFGVVVFIAVTMKF